MRLALLTALVLVLPLAGCIDPLKDAEDQAQNAESGPAAVDPFDSTSWNPAPVATREWGETKPVRSKGDLVLAEHRSDQAVVQVVATQAGIECRWDASEIVQSWQDMGMEILSTTAWCAGAPDAHGDQLASVVEGAGAAGSILLLDEAPVDDFRVFLSARALLQRDEQTTQPALLAGYSGLFVSVAPMTHVAVGGVLFGCDEPDDSEDLDGYRHVTESTLYVRHARAPLNVVIDPTPSRIVGVGDVPEGVEVVLQEGKLLLFDGRQDGDFDLPLVVDLEAASYDLSDDGPHTCGLLLGETSQDWALLATALGVHGPVDASLESPHYLVFVGAG